MSPRPHVVPVAHGPSVFPPSPLTPPHFLGFLPHPGNRAPPAPRRTHLPAPAGWTRSEHAAPAAYPKQLRESHGSLGRASEPFGNTRPIPGESGAERKARVEGAVGQAVLARLDASQWTLDQAAKDRPKGLFVAVERWSRDKPVAGHTLVCTHPNGTQKEVRPHHEPADGSTGIPRCAGFSLAQLPLRRSAAARRCPMSTSSSTISG